MQQGTFALLADRGVIRLRGSDAGKLLQSLITNDMALLDQQGALHAALLSPQGKVLFDFFVVKSPEGYLLDVRADRAADLAKRFSLYKLRSDVSIQSCSDELSVIAGADLRGSSSMGALGYPDPRLAALGWRAFVPNSGATISTRIADLALVDAAHYHATRIALGVPEGGADFDFGDAFPHEALLDQLHGVSFTKGCYVGQEIVARMEHRGTARKRIVPVSAAGNLAPDRAPVLAGEAEIGRMGSVAGNLGLALLRLDRVAEARAQGQAITTDGAPISVQVPAFATFTIEPAK